MNKLGLHIRMVIAAVIIISAVTVCLDIAGIYIIRNYMLERFKSRIIFLAKYLAVNSEVGVLIRDKSGLNSLAVNLLGEEDVALVTIVDSDNNILAKQSRNIPGRLYSVETSVTLNKTDAENFLFKEYRNTPFGTLNIKGVDSIGKVKIKYSTRGINILIRGVTIQFVLVSVVLAFLAGILFYFIVKESVIDVTRLALVSKQIGDGDLELRAEPGTLPETRELASAFNYMLNSLEKGRKAYEQVTKEAAQQKALAELGKFSLSVAHEVKNPLAIIKTAFEFLQKEYLIPNDNTMGRYINDEILRLNRLIENFLLFAKPGNIVFENVSIDQFMEGLEKRYAILYNDSPIDIQWQLEALNCKIRCDENLLIQVFDNIVKNAVESSQEDLNIIVKSYNENYFWFIEISDNGHGIEQGTEIDIFKPFFTTKSKGTGLGLALVYQIINAHNGIIYVENNSDGGAMFTLKIPVI